MGKKQFVKNENLTNFWFVELRNWFMIHESWTLNSISVLAICQKSWEQSFWEVIDSLVLVAYVSLAASTTLLQWLLACLNFTLDSLRYFSELYSFSFIRHCTVFLASLYSQTCIRWTLLGPLKSGCCMKCLYKMTISQISLFLAGF